MEEIWKDVTGYVGYYQISNCGRIKRIKAGYGTQIGKIKNVSLGPNGYRRVSLTVNSIKKDYYIHRLVATAFIPNPENKPCVNHINGVKTDNRAENLEWVTYQENNAHAYRTGLHLVTDEIRKKISDAQKGKQISEESRKRMSDAHKGHVSNMKGKHHSEDAKRKMSDAHKGKHHSEETRKKISKTLKSRVCTKQWGQA